MLKSGVLKTIRTYKNKIKRKLLQKNKNYLKTLYIETWFQFVNKKHLIDEAVKLAVAFFEDGKIRIVRSFGVKECLSRKCLPVEGVSMFVHALM